ncbi:MAG: DUF2332 family protein [Candidatus Sericytochromatia bacterium]
MIKDIKEGFKKQSEICSATSLLYRDILEYSGSHNIICEFIDDIYNHRKFNGVLEAVLTYTSYIHFKAIENHSIKRFFKSYGGFYSQENYKELSDEINNIFVQDKELLEKWMKNTILQTNEVARSIVLYPALLSLNLKEINLIELGSSAGLILYMDKYSYKYIHNDREYISKKEKPLLTSRVNDLTAFEKLLNNRDNLTIKSRLGFDLNCIDLKNSNNIKMLKSFIWDSPERLERLEDAIQTQNKYYSNEPIVHSSVDYTNDLSEYILKSIDNNIPTIIYTSVSTYQISDDLYKKLYKQIENLSSKISQVYFIEFEAPRHEEHLGINKDEPFIVKINDVSLNRLSIFSFAHFHGLSIRLI